MWLNGDCRTAPVACNISGGAVPRVLSELLENRNYLNLILYMISTDILVFFKFRKNLEIYILFTAWL
jgi:hypothetical protein